MGCAFSLMNRPESLVSGHPHVEMATSSYGNMVLFIFNLTVLCVSTLILSYYLLLKSKNSAIFKFLCFYGENTITILCMHGIILMPLVKFSNVIDTNDSIFFPFLITVVCFLILYPIINTINKYLPNIVGKH